MYFCEIEEGCQRDFLGSGAHDEIVR